MHIAIDGNEANVTQRVGSNAYAYELLQALEKKLTNQTDISVTVLLSRSKVVDMPAERKGWQYKVVGPSSFWTQYALPLHLFLHRKEYNVFYTPGHYGPRVSTVPYVSSVMDLAFLFFPKQFRKRDLFQLREWTRYSVKYAKKIIAISEHTKKDVMKFYHVPEKKVVVAYPGLKLFEGGEVKEKEKSAFFKKHSIHQPYILYVGTLQPRKNLLRLIEAFEILLRKKDHTNLERTQLVMAGKVGWLAKEIEERARKSPLKDKIIFTGFVSENEKVLLYKHSACTVLVGLYEGFGIPALEAMAYGTIPVVSKTTSLPEVVDSAGISVDPLSSEDIARGLLKAIELSAKEHAVLLKKGREQVKKFSWEKSAEVVLRTLKEVARS